MTAVLVVDDDPAIVRALCRILESEGYSVRPAASAQEALRVGDGVSLAIIDVMMPGMNGLELAGRLRQDRPGFPILFVTGAPELVDLALFPGAHLIAKPWRVSALLDSVRQLLAAS